MSTVEKPIVVTDHALERYKQRFSGTLVEDVGRVYQIIVEALKRAFKNKTWLLSIKGEDEYVGSEYTKWFDVGTGMIYVVEENETEIRIVTCYKSKDVTFKCNNEQVLIAKFYDYWTHVKTGNLPRKEITEIAKQVWLDAIKECGRD